MDKPITTAREEIPAFKPPSRINHWTVGAAFLLALFYFATSIIIAAHRLLWFDEIVTVLFAGLPGPGTIWKAVGHVDPWGMPAPYYMLVHAFQTFFGPPEVAARLPSALAVAGGLLVTFDCTRRLTDGIHGLISVSFLACSFLPYYAFEARSYGICFLLAALSLWVWAHTTRGVASAAVFGLFFFLGFLMHPYTVLGIIPYAIWDLSRWRSWRLPSLKIMTAGLGIACAIAVLSFDIAIARTGGRQFSGPHPSISALEGTFPELFPGGLLLLAVAVAWIAVAGAESQPRAVPSMPEVERLGWLFLLLPVAGYVLAALVTNAFVSRYFIGMLPGVAVAFSCLLWRYFHGTRLVAAGILCLLTITGVSRQIDTLRHPSSIDPYGQQTKTYQVLGLEKALQSDDKHFILIPGTLLYMEAQHYSTQPGKYRFLATADPTNRMPVYFAEYYPFTIWQLNDLKQHARETALIFPEPKLLDALKQAGITSTVRFSEPIRVVYLQ